MFVDKVAVEIVAGNGGDGIVSFRHEIYVDKGGPDGGDGGKGGDVVFEASRNQNTLAAFRYQKLIKADDGNSGSSAKKRGRSAKDNIVPVPVGTTVLSEAGDVIVDLATDGQRAIVAFGGRGGYGNAHFVSSVRQAPKVSEKGEKGQTLGAVLELRMIADVGLIGLPNAGKSSLLTAISNARPEIANYPFTTLRPHLGVVDVSGESLLFADIPGLIEGASEGKGLGDDFLRHVSRCGALLHLIDSNSNDITEVYKTIRGELSAYSKEIAKKPEIIVLTKAETLTPDLVEMQKELLTAVVPKKSKIFTVSSYAKQGLDDLLYEVLVVVKKQRTVQAKKAAKDDPGMPVITLKETPDAWKLRKTKKGFEVTGRKIERFAERTDFDNEFGVQRLRDIMNKMGIMRQLRREGINPGDNVTIGNPSRGEITY